MSIKIDNRTCVRMWKTKQNRLDFFKYLKFYSSRLIKYIRFRSILFVLVLVLCKRANDNSTQNCVNNFLRYGFIYHYCMCCVHKKIKVLFEAIWSASDTKIPIVLPFLSKFQCINNNNDTNDIRPYSNIVAIFWKFIEFAFHSIAIGFVDNNFLLFT